MNCLVVSVLIIVVVIEISGYKTYSALNSIVFTNIPEPKDNVHSEYYFGQCATRFRTLIDHDHLKYNQIRGNMIIRGQLNVTDMKKFPNCVYIRATSPYADMVTYNPHKFTICFLRIVHYHAGFIFYYNYYEWYIPVEIQENIDWDLYFFTA